MSVHSFSTPDLSDHEFSISPTTRSSQVSPIPSAIAHTLEAVVNPRSSGSPKLPDSHVTDDESSASIHLSEDSRIPLCYLDSFLPVFRIFGMGLVLSDNAYHLRGGFNREEREKAWAYARSVGGFTLSDTTPGRNSEYPIAPGTMMRLLQLHSQDLCEPFFPSLTQLRVINATSSLPQLWSLFLTPSLDSLEVVGIADAEESALVSFLTSLVHVALRLETITFGPGPIPMHPTELCLEFTHLQELRLLHPVETSDFSFLEQIGQLPNLETLSINTKIPSWYDPLLRHSDTSLPKVGFRMLKTLHVVAILEVLQDLIGHLATEDMKDISLTLLTSPEGPPPPEPPSLGATATTSWKKPKPRAPVEQRSTPPNEDAAFARLVDDVLWLWKATLTSICIYQKQQQQQPDPESIPFTPGLQHWDFAPLRTHSLSTETVQRLLSHGPLEHLDIDGWDLDFSLKEFIKPGHAYKMQQLQALKLPLHAQSGIPSLTDLRLVLQAFPNLVSFQCHISDVTLDVPDYSNVNLFLPKLEPYPRFEELVVGYESDLPRMASPVPCSGPFGDSRSGPFYVPPPGPFGEPAPAPPDDPYRFVRAAQYLDALFPNLQAIKTRNGFLDPDWRYIDRLIKMCQISRSLHMA